MEERQAVNLYLPCLPSTPSSHLPLLQKYQRVLHTLIPSQGDLPPPKDFFPITPVPPPVESFHPTAEEISLDPESHLDLPESMPLVARWNSLVSPPDNVATNIAIEGLKLKFHTAPPLCPRDFPPPSAFTSDNQIVPLTPFVEDWLKRGILTKTGIPQAVFFSRMFHVSKKPARGTSELTAEQKKPERLWKSRRKNPCTSCSTRSFSPWSPLGASFRSLRQIFVLPSEAHPGGWFDGLI